MSEEKTFAWPDGKRCAINLSFDDARLTQVENGFAILDRHNIKATFYVSFGALSKYPEEWKQALANGHEIGNHTVNHPCSCNFPWAKEFALEDYTLEMMEEEILGANEKLEELLGITPKTFAYPCGMTYVGRGINRRSYVPLVAKHFIAGRAYLSEPVNDPAYLDAAVLCGTGVDSMSIDELNELVDTSLKTGSWLNMVAHDVPSGNGIGLSCENLDLLCKRLTEESDIWVDTIENITDYVISQRNG
ncbi:MAG: polysaccharide deacetylase family protein [Lentisphaeria bacterium]|nr:polysaccharide deacetylase family protein [Lentisphaeria bacterium]NQZ70269.1 polysaccharide deacetylase family protein [Lentisphaeria bacterium]